MSESLRNALDNLNTYYEGYEHHNDILDCHIKNKDYLEINYKKSAEMALEISQKTLNKVKESIGFLSL